MKSIRSLIRSPLATGAALALAVSLVACGSDSGSAGSSESSGGSESTGGSTASGEGVFPATVEHKFGTTTVPEEPTRVVSVGLTEQDTLLQLGVTPIATTEWYGEQPHAVWPWATDLLGDAEPEVLSQSDGIEFEKVAALEPDLIVGVNAGLTKKDYDLLSAIAPTIASVEGSTQYFSPWRDQVLQIARGLGREAEGQALVDEIDGRYAEIAAEHPDWAGKTATFSQGAPYSGELYVYPDGLSTDFLTDLGFEITPGLEEYSPSVGEQALISAENVDLIDADLIVFATESKRNFDDLLDWSTIDDLEAVKENRTAYTDGTLAGAIYFDTPLAHAYILDNLVPMIEQATAGKAPREFPG